MIIENVYPRETIKESLDTSRFLIRKANILHDYYRSNKWGQGNESEITIEDLELLYYQMGMKYQICQEPKDCSHEGILYPFRSPLTVCTSCMPLGAVWDTGVELIAMAFTEFKLAVHYSNYLLVDKQKYSHRKYKQDTLLNALWKVQWITRGINELEILVE